MKIKKFVQYDIKLSHDYAPLDWRNPYAIGNRRLRREAELRERTVRRLLGKKPKTETIKYMMNNLKKSPNSGGFLVPESLYYSIGITKGE